MDAIAEMNFSEFLRHSGDALARVEKEDLRLNRRDGEDLFLKPIGREEAEHESLGAAGSLLAGLLDDEQVAVKMKGVLVQSLPWTYYLSEGDRQQFVTQFLQTIAAATSLGSYRQVGVLVKQWKNTALALSRPEVMAAFEHFEEGDLVQRPDTA